MKHLLKRYREDLHRIPELGYKENKTKEYILKVISQYDCTVDEPCSTAVLAYFQGRRRNETDGGKTIAFRCDMDGLLITEATGLSFSSEHEGLMHACGHDGHTSMLLGLAREIHTNLDKISCNVLLIFQPAEEGGGGAEELCHEGILDQYHVSRIYGYHLWPGIPKHTIASAPGPVMAKTTEMDIIIEGKSCHCASPEQGIDSLYLGCQFLCDIYRMEKEEVADREYRLLKFGKCESGTIRNILSNHTVFFGTMRCFDMAIFEFMLNRIHQIAKRYEEKYGCHIRIDYNAGYPAVVNDEKVFWETKRMLSETMDFQRIEKPFMQSEDFSFYLTQVPGLLMFLGVGDTPPLHSNHFDFDEEVLFTGLKGYKKILGI